MLARTFIPALALIGTLSVAPVFAGDVRAPLPDGSTLSLSLPSDWQSSSRTAGPAVTLRLTPAVKSKDFVVLITALPVKPGSPASTPEGVQASVTEEGNRSLASAVQKHLELSEVQGRAGTAYLYHVTDRNPEKGPGDYREANQGAMLLGKHLLTITILTHTGDTSTVDQAKQAIASAKIDSER